MNVNEREKITAHQITQPMLARSGGQHAGGAPTSPRQGIDIPGASKRALTVLSPVDVCILSAFIYIRVVCAVLCLIEPKSLGEQSAFILTFSHGSQPSPL